MTAQLPEYAPPSSRRAGVAAGGAPLLVLLAFTLIVTRVIDADTGLAVFLACAVWVVHEMDAYQRGIDAYDAAYVDTHLSWRSSDALRAYAGAPDVAEPTRDFVQRFLAADCVLLEDGQRP